ncbi:MAG: monovalent cation/H+ antiporter subunit D family protein [Clostridiales bacterium]|nr:monovalent cation/H+ antiporter subunit D family protein [Clostridiales bacterium]
MVNEHFPIYMLAILLVNAAIFSAFTKLSFRFLKRVVVVNLLLIWIMGVSLFVKVVRDGAFRYNFGDWHQAVGVQFYVDELAVFMMMFILTLSNLIIIYSLKDIEHEIESKQFARYYTLVFLMIFSMLGLTFSNDMFNMFIFMEILSIASCSIISIKNSKGSTLASFRYLILNTLGSLSVLMGIALIYMVTGQLNMNEIHGEISVIWKYYPTNIMMALAFIIIGFGTKAAIFPLHIWLPDAHSVAPTPSSALLSGIVVKVYIFAIIKLLFRVIGVEIVGELGIPTAIAYLAAIGTILGSIFAIAQKDIKRMLAYSSVAQIGYIFLGVGLATKAGLEFAMFHIVSHGLIKTALFLSAGAIIYQTEKRDIRKLDGIAYEMPATMMVFAIAALGMIGIPGTSGFMSKIFLGSVVLQEGKAFYLFIIILSSFLNAFYYMPIITSAFMKSDSEAKVVNDKIPRRMVVPMVIVIFLSIAIGFYPQLITEIIEIAVDSLL